MTQISDDFNRSDGSLAEGDLPWPQVANELYIVAQAVACPPSSEVVCAHRHPTQLDSTQQFARVRVTAIAGEGLEFMGPAVRMHDDAQHWYDLSTDGFMLGIEKYRAGAYLGGTYKVDVALSPGDIVELRVQEIGGQTVLRAYINGQLVTGYDFEEHEEDEIFAEDFLNPGDVIDIDPSGAITTGQYAGLFAFTVSDGQEMRVDDFAAGDQDDEGGQEIPVGLATETDSAFGLTRAKRKAIGLVSESDVSQAVMSLRRYILELASEQNTALDISPLKERSVGPGIESDQALAFVARHAIPVGLAMEADTLLPLTARKRREAGLAAESSIVLPVDRLKERAVIVVAETDSSLAAHAHRAYTIGLSAETDSATTMKWSKSRMVRLVNEFDQALRIASAVVAERAERARRLFMGYLNGR